MGVSKLIKRTRMRLPAWGSGAFAVILAAVAVAGCGGDKALTSAKKPLADRCGSRALGLAHLRSRRSAHLRRPDHPHRINSEDVAASLVLSDPGRSDGDPNGGERRRLRRLVGRLLLRCEPGDGEARLEDETSVPECGDTVPGRTAPRHDFRRRSRELIGMVPGLEPRPDPRS